MTALEIPATAAGFELLRVASVDRLTDDAVAVTFDVPPELAEQYRCADGSAAIPLTHDELASLAGSSRLTVERVLHELRESGRVRTQRGRITVEP